MAGITITYNPITQQIYVSPPLAMLTGYDQAILFSLNGGGEFKWRSPAPGEAPISLINADEAGPGYSDWPTGYKWIATGDSWLLSLPPNQAKTTVYYKWMYHLQSNDGLTFIDDDPDIGNDPPSGP